MTNSREYTPDGPARPGRRRHWLRTFGITLLVLVILAVALDFVAKYVAQGEAASQIKKQGFPEKPSVTVEGFPFLTQVASRDIHQVRISAQNIAEGPVRISSVSAVASGIHLSRGYSSGTVDLVSGSLLISFPALASTLTSQIGPLGSLAGNAGLNLSAASGDEVKASLNLLVTSGSATWRFTRLNGDKIHVKLVTSQGLPSSLLGPIGDFTLSVPRLPLGVMIDSVRVTPQGLTASLSGRDLPFGS